MTVSLARRLEKLLAAGETAILVTVAEALGSTPRAAGTRMLVTAQRFYGTVGGGRLEWEAQGHARAMLAQGAADDSLDLPLGPAVGQCCGGRVVLALRRAVATTVGELAVLEAAEAERCPQVLICGAGHVGTALAQALIPLPLAVRWVDARPELAREEDPSPTLGDPVDAVAEVRANAAVVTMTHSHDLDYAVGEAALRRGDLAYVGMIGSATKRRKFQRLFVARGGDPRALDRLVCPIGDFGVVDKRPEVIAAFAAAEMLRALGTAGALADPGAAEPTRAAS
jgi:xanthine dehydrogenase accessory protein XdhC